MAAKRNHGAGSPAWTGLSGWNNGRNPASILSGIACLEVLKEEGVYEKLDHLGAMLEEGILQHAKTHGITITVNRLKVRSRFISLMRKSKITSRLNG